MTPFAPIAAVVALESEVTMRAIADEGALELLIEPSPPSPRPRHYPRADDAAIERDASRATEVAVSVIACAPFATRAAVERVIEPHARYAARRMGKVELVVRVRPTTRHCAMCGASPRSMPRTRRSGERRRRGTRRTACRAGTRRGRSARRARRGGPAARRASIPPGRRR